jgi:hypothetical protein
MYSTNCLKFYIFCQIFLTYKHVSTHCKCFSLCKVATYLSDFKIRALKLTQK